MQKRYLKLSFSLLFITLASLSFPLKIATGVKYTFRNTFYENYIVLTSSLERKIVIFNMKTQKIDYFLSNIGIYPAISYLYKDKLLIIDSVGKQLILYNINNSVVNTKNLENKPVFYKRFDNIVYVLDSTGNLYGFNFDLETVYFHKFLSDPDYFDFFNSKPIAFYIWRNEFDVEYEEKLLNFNLTTPVFMVSKYILDFRGGKILDFETKKVYETAPYISFGVIWNNKLYFGSMFSKEIYAFENDKIYSEAKLDFPPTSGKILNNKLYILSAPKNKLIIVGKDIKTYDTGNFPVDVYSFDNKIFVICAENGEINIIENKEGG